MKQITMTDESEWRKEPTQAERILAMLQAWESGVCGTQFLEAMMPRYPARILELKRDGYGIERVSCPYSYLGHPSAVATYRLDVVGRPVRRTLPPS